MNRILIILASALAQFSQYSYGFDPPIVYAPEDFHYIHFIGEVYSKKYVIAIMNNGDKTTIPVINNIVPTIKSKRLATGGMQRDFWYDEKIKYNGETIIKYIPGYKKKVISPPIRLEKDKSSEESIEIREPEKSLPIVENEQILDLKDSIVDLHKTIAELRKTVEKQQAQVVPELKKVDSYHPSMKKPSEFDKE